HEPQCAGDEVEPPGHAGAQVGRGGPGHRTRTVHCVSPVHSIVVVVVVVSGSGMTRLMAQLTTATMMAPQNAGQNPSTWNGRVNRPRTPATRSNKNARDT